MRTTRSEFLAVFALVAILVAQKPAEKPETAVFKADTRLVQISVVVHDKNGPVEGLKQDDFVLLDRGKEVPIAFFSEDSTRKAPEKVKPLPPNVFINQPSVKSDAPSTVSVVLLDGLNTSLPDQSYARQQIIRFLKQLNPNDRVALYTLGSSLKVLVDFTDDPEILRRALAKFFGTSTSDAAASEPDPSQSGDADLDAFVDAANAVLADHAQTNRTVGTLSALEAIAGHIGGIPGRKNLIWISSSFPLTIGFDDPSAWGDPSREMRSFSDEVRRATRALNNANIAVYPVDARGLVAVPDRFTAASPVKATPQSPLAKASMVPKGLDAMNELASATGGRAFYNTNDIAGSVHKAVEDSAVTYTLGFYPKAEELDGKFHEFKVRVKRKGTNVRYRKGFIAFKEESPTPKQREEAMRSAVLSPLEATGVPLAARVERIEKPEPNTVWAVVQLDVHALQLTHENDRWLGKIDVMFMQQDKTGKVLDSSRQTVDLKLENKNYEQYAKNGMVMQRFLRASPELATLRVVIQDHANGTIGSLIVPMSKVKKGVLPAEGALPK